MNARRHRLRARRFDNHRQGYRTVKVRRPSVLIRDFDPRIPRSAVLDQREQRRRMRRVQPDAAMGGRTAELRDVVGAVNGEAVIEEAGR